LSDTDKASSGIANLDNILGGGFVRHRIHLLEGRPGTGKTTLALQFLFEGRKRGEKTLYIALSETAQELESSAASHGWTLEGIAIFELAPPDADSADEQRQTLFHSSEVELGEVTRQIFAEVERVNPACVVLDSLSEMNMLAQNPLRYRRQILALKRFLTKRGTTALLLDDLTAPEHDLQLHSIAHGVVTLEQNALDYGTERRRLRVAKLRGINFHNGFHDYEIRAGGLEVFPRLNVSGRQSPLGPQSQSIVRSVAPQLDDMLGGGLRCGTSTLLMGPAGSGKSSVALSYVVNAVKQDERAALYAFDESTESICGRAAGLNMDIRSYVESGRLTLRKINPAEMSPGEFVQMVSRSVTDDKAKIVVIDSLNGYLNAMPEEQNLVLQMHDLLTFLNQRDVLSFVIVAQHGLIGSMQSPVDLSYLSDNVLLLRFFEADGRIRKAVSVIKKRVGAHEESIREFRLNSKGLQVGEPLTGFQGIMTGVPNYQGTQAMLKVPGANAR
jgi:circadian clock protein KaiC